MFPEVDLRGEWPENHSMAVLRMLMPTLLTACICMVAGMRSLAVMPRRLIALIPGRQLWQLVSAMTERVVDLGDKEFENPNVA